MSEHAIDIFMFTALDIIGRSALENAIAMNPIVNAHKRDKVSTIFLGYLLLMLAYNANDCATD